MAVTRQDWAMSESGLVGFARACLLACVVGSVVIMVSQQVKKRSSTVAWVGAAVVAAAGPVRLWLGRTRSQGLGWPRSC